MIETVENVPTAVESPPDQPLKPNKSRKRRPTSPPASRSSPGIAPYPIEDANAADNRNNLDRRPTGEPIPLPKPPAYDCTPDQFFLYWHNLLPSERERAIVYPYRLWPVTDAMQVLSHEEIAEIAAKRAQAPITNLGKMITPFDPTAWTGEILHRFGTGDYHLKLNDTVLRKTICMCTVKGLRDFDHYPPVLNIKELVITDPANQSYIKWCQVRGIKIPEVEDLEEAEDMANAETTRALTDQVGKLTDKVITMSQNKPPSSDAATHSALKASEVVAEAAKAGQTIVAEAFKTAREMQVKAQDPAQYFRDVTEAAKSLVPPAPASTGPGFMEIAALFTGIMQNQSNQFQNMLTLIQAQNSAVLEEMRGRIKMAELAAQEARDKSTRPATTDPNAPAATGELSRPKTLAAMVKEYRDLAELLGGGAGTGGDDSGIPKWIPYVTSAATMLMGGIANMMYNAKLQPGQAPIAPPPMDPNAIQPGDQDDDGQDAPGAAGHLSEQEQLMNLVQNLEKPLLQALREGKSGTQFAAEIIVLQGDMAYSWMQEQGAERIISYLQMYPPLWSELIKIPDKFTHFLNEFMLGDDARRLAQQIKARMAAPMASQNAQPRRTQPVQPSPAAPAAAQPTPQASQAPIAPQAANQSANPLPQAVVDAQSTQSSSKSRPKGGNNSGSGAVIDTTGQVV